MTTDIEFDIDYGGLVDYVDHLQKKMGEPIEMVKAIREGGTYLTAAWIKNAESKFKHSQGGYARGIKEGTQYPYQGDPLQYKVVHPSKVAVYLEHGYEAFDMKKALQTSLKVRITKNGKRYLVIPFEHGTPGSKSKRAMPKEVYEQAKKLKSSYSIEAGTRGAETKASTYKDAMLLRELNPRRVTQRNYQWGDRLKNVDQPLLKDKPSVHRVFDRETKKYTKVTAGAHKSNIYEGMVKFESNPNIVREKFGLGKFEGSNQSDNWQTSGRYMTFRIMHEDSNGWIHPGLTPMNILGEVLESGKPVVQTAVAEAAKKDMLNAIRLRGEGII